MSAPILLEMKKDYINDPKNFSYRRYILKVKKDELAMKELDTKYPSIQGLSEKMYLYLNDMDSPPEDKIFKDFMYHSKEDLNKPNISEPEDSKGKIKTVNPVSEIETIPYKNYLEQEDNFDDGELESMMSMIDKALPEIIVTFAEDKFKKLVSDCVQKTVYFMTLNHSSGDWFSIFYVKQDSLVYLTLLPKTTKIAELKIFLERDFNMILEIGTMPLYILKDVTDRNIQECNSIAKMAYVLSKRYTLY